MMLLASTIKYGCRNLMTIENGSYEGQWKVRKEISPRDPVTQIDTKFGLRVNLNGVHEKSLKDSSLTLSWKLAILI